MKCPTDEDLLRAELTVNEVRVIEQHESTCPSCRAARRSQRELAGDVAAAPPLADTEDAFVARVMESCRPNAAQPRQKKPVRRSWPALGVSLAAAAALAVWRVVPSQTPAETWAARGAAHRGFDVDADILLARDKTLMPLRGAVLAPGDGIAVRYWNRGAGVRYLAVFAIDAAGTVHWIHPAYLDEKSNPTSVALEPAPEPKLLGEIVAPERPAAGDAKVVAVVSKEPFSVRAIEQRILRNQGPISALFDSAQVQEWTCKWQNH
ncbi:MAG TPA: hypothetical protein VF881_21230 [Polyangiaceae bacterium]